MSDLEKRAVLALLDVRCKPETWHARRIAQLDLKRALRGEARLIVTESADLWFLVWHYRRQITDAGVVAEADRIRNGALNLIFDLEPSLAKS